MGARRLSAAAFAVSGALIGGLWAVALSLIFSGPGLIQIPVRGPLDLVARVAAGAGVFAIPWALVGAGVGPALARADGRGAAARIGVAAAGALTVVGVGLPLVLVGEDVSRAWIPVGAGVTLGFTPFAIASAVWAWHRLRRTRVE